MFNRIKSLLDRFRGRSKVISSYVPAYRVGLPAYNDPEEWHLLNKYIGDVYACVSLRADAVSMSKLQLFSSKGSKTQAPARRVSRATADFVTKQASLRPWTIKADTMEDIVEVTEHPLLDLLKRVNPYHNQFEFFEALSVYLDILGRCYIFMARDTLGRVVELWPLPPDKMHGVYSRQSLIDHWIYRPGSEDIRYETSEVLYHRMFSPVDMLDGWSPLKACLRAANLSTSILDYETALLKNHAVPDMIVIGEGPIHPDNEKRFREGWKTRHAGKNVGGVGMIGGVKDIITAGMSPKDLGHESGMDRVRDRICNAFRVPKSMLTSDDVNRANADSGHVQFARWAIAPRHRKLEQWLNQDLVPLFDDTGTLFLAWENAVPEDRVVRIQEIKEHIAAGYTSPNEERAKDGLEPREGGDEYHDPPDPEEMLASRPPVRNAGSSGKGGSLKKRTVSVVQKITDGPGEDPKARGLQTELQRYFALQERDVLGRSLLIPVRDEPVSMPNIMPVDANGNGHGRMATAIVAKDRETDLLQRLLFSQAVWDQILSERAAPYIRAMISAGAEDGGKQLAEIDVAFDLSQSEALEFLEQRTIRFSGRFAKKVNKTTREQLTQSLAEGISAGDTGNEIRKRIKAIYRQASQERASMIARSETKRALEAGRKASYQSAGVEKMQWVADPNACEFCRPFDGKIIATSGEAFLPKGASHEGDEGGTMANNFETVRHPPLHPNCTCFIVPVVE